MIIAFRVNACLACIALVGSFNQVWALVEAFSVIVQHRRFIVCSTSAEPAYAPLPRTAQPQPRPRHWRLRSFSISRHIAGVRRRLGRGPQCPMSISTLKEFRQKVSCLKIVHRLKWSSRLLTTSTSDILLGRCTRPARFSADILNI